MHAVRVVIIPEFTQLARQVHRIPEEHAVEKLSANRADQSFDERMRNRYVGHRLDLINFEYTQIRQPARAGSSLDCCLTPLFFSC